MAGPGVLRFKARAFSRVIRLTEIFLLKLCVSMCDLSIQTSADTS